ncbi:unnamed protein product [Agarophyton chilense]
MANIVSDAIAEEEFAYAIGIQIYTFAQPLLICERERNIRLNPPDFNGQLGLAPVACLNDIGHMENVSTADDVVPYMPNCDTVYSAAYIELVDEPIVLTAPTITDRYWSIQLADCYATNVAYIGTRATNGEGGNFILVGPNYDGDLPSDMPVQKLDYNSCMFFLRIAPLVGVNIDEEKDLAKIHEYQKQFYLTSLSNWKMNNIGVAAVPESVKTRPQYIGDLAYYQIVADLFIENPPISAHDAQTVTYKYVGLEVGQKFDPDSISEGIRAGLVRAANMGRKIMDWQVNHTDGQLSTRWKLVEEGCYGYNYPPRAKGALGGLLVHDWAEAEYFMTVESTVLDEDGKPTGGEPFDSKNKYVMYFAKDRIPKVNTAKKAFWSVTAYGPDKQLVPNDKRRYSVGDRTLIPDKDGGITIYLQRDDPKGEVGDPNASNNWLPIPHDDGDMFKLLLRIYIPRHVSLHPVPPERFAPPVLLRESASVRAMLQSKSPMCHCDDK